MVFFMPYLHYETDVARLHQHYIVKNVDTQAEEDDEFTDQEIRKLRCNVDEKLIRKYLRSPSPLHLRRTLDQSYYYTLPNTLIRDRDQVVLRYVKKELPTVEISPPVLMVDQCWLWVLGGKSSPSHRLQSRIDRNSRYRHHLFPRLLERREYPETE